MYFIDDNLTVSNAISLIKKPGLDPQVFKNYRPAKLIEKVIFSRIHKHKLIDKFQSEYRCGHSTERATGHTWFY